MKRKREAYTDTARNEERVEMKTARSGMHSRKLQASHRFNFYGKMKSVSSPSSKSIERYVIARLDG